MRLELFAPAKLNLHLSVGPPRADGYHPLVTLMQPLDVGDRLVIETGRPGLRFSCNLPELAGEDNLVVRAACAWYEAAGKEPGIAIQLDKQIPVAAGLGGGSSDAAATLLGLNALHGSPLEPRRLYELACSLGADVPFFLAGCTALCTGIGEVVQPLPEFPRLDYVLLNPGLAVSTARIYRQFDLHWTKPESSYRINRSHHEGTFWEGLLINDLEAVTLALHPVLAELKEALRGAGARGVLMSGSGPTLFGVFDSPDQAVRAADSLACGHPSCWVRPCRGL